MKTYLSLILALSFLPGCWWSRSSRVGRPHVANEKIVGTRELECSVVLLEPKEYPGYIAGLEGYAVLHIQLFNRGNATYRFIPSYCTLPRESAFNIAPLVHYDTSSRVTWLSLPALLYLWEAIPLVVMPLGFYWRSWNQEVSAWLERKTLGPLDSFEIAPYENTDRYIFVPEQGPWRYFGISFFEVDEKQLVSFSVTFDREKTCK